MVLACPLGVIVSLSIAKISGPVTPLTLLRLLDSNLKQVRFVQKREDVGGVAKECRCFRYTAGKINICCIRLEGLDRH